MNKRAMKWDEVISFYHIDISPEQVAFNFAAQGVKPTTLLEWLSQNGIDGDVRGFVGLESETKAVNEKQEGKYLGFLKSKNGFYDHRRVPFSRVMRFIGNDMSNWDKFNKDCVWLQFEMPDFTVEYILANQDKEDADVAMIIIATHRKKLLPALQFFFKTLNNPDFTPIISLPAKS